MIQLIANMIVITALGGAILIVAIVIVKAILALAAAGSTTLSRPAAVSQKACRYCGAALGEKTKCEYCGAVNQTRKQPKP